MTIVNHLLPHPILSTVLLILWLLLTNSLSFGQFFLGLLLGGTIPLLTKCFWPERVIIHKPFRLLRYIAILLFDIVTANFIVAKLVLGNPDRLKPVFVELPLDLTSDLAISLLANSITLTPGTVSAQLSADRKHLLIHALNETDPDAMIAAIKQRYEQPLKEIFEKC